MKTYNFMRIIKKIFRPRRISLGLIISLTVFLILIVPVFSFAYNIGDPLVSCGTNDPKFPLSNHPCGFSDFLDLINNVIQFILYVMVVPIAAVMFFYAGFELVTSGGSTEKRGTAKKVFTNAVIGLVIAVGAFLIVQTILHILGFDGSWLGFKK